MKKKFLILLLSIIFVFNLSGCWIIASGLTGCDEPVNEEELFEDVIIDEEIDGNADEDDSSLEETEESSDYEKVPWD